MKKIAVAMSGGVDSSVAAALMVEKYGAENVFGVTLKLFCDSGDAIKDSKAVCKKLGIKHYVADVQKEFNDIVVNDFIANYSIGETPIPCIYCNPKVKFSALLLEAKKHGAGKVATGHYARIEEGKGESKLLKGIDKEKDQSYFLYRLTKEQLSRVIFPLGEMTKKEVRDRARKIGLKTAEKKDSQGVCFISGQSVADYVGDRTKRIPGKIVDTKGNIIGNHEGIIYYTTGQRKRIGGGHKEPMFVVRIDSGENKVVIGTKKELYGRKLEMTDPYFANKVKLPKKCTAKIRYNTEDEKCVIKKDNKVIFKKPQRAITPGQSVVFYDKDVCLGGGIIKRQC